MSPYLLCSTATDKEETLAIANMSHVSAVQMWKRLHFEKNHNQSMT